MKAKSTLRRHFAIVVAIGLGCTLMILSMATLVAAGGGTPTVNGLFYGDGDDSNYYFLGEDPGRGKLYYNRDGDTLYLAVVVSNTVNDNVFGKESDDDTYVMSVGWVKTKGGHAGEVEKHTFEKLYSSDRLQLELSCGGTTWTWEQDYLASVENINTEGVDPDAVTWYSDYTGNDGSGTPPDPDNLVSHSSLEWNMENTDWDVTLGGTRTAKKGKDWKSPDPLTDYPNFDTTDKWEWAMVYEMSINVSDCGSNDITIKVPRAHNSPSKDGTSDVPICETGCSVPVVDLELSKDADNYSPNPGEQVMLTISVTNKGPDNATGVKVKDIAWPGKLTYNSDDSGGDYNPATYIWDVGDLAVDAWATLHITATVNDWGYWENIAEVWECDQDDIDSTPANYYPDYTIEDDTGAVSGNATPTAITLSSFAANSNTGGSVNPLWLGLAGLTLAAGSLFWTKRRVG